MKRIDAAQRLLAGLAIALACSSAMAGGPQETELKAEISSLRQTVEALLQRVAALEAEKKQLAQPAAMPQRDTASDNEEAAARIDASPQGAVAATMPSAPQDTAEALGLPHPVMPEHPTIDEDADSAARLDNEPPPNDPTLAGFMLIPGTDTRIRIGGYAKLDVIADSDDAGDSDLLITSAIPAGAQSGHRSVNMHARQTRFNFEARRPTSVGTLRFFLENDFYGSGGRYGYNLRHAFGQIGNTYAGYGWSAFMDLDSGADTIDFAGPGAAPFGRVASLRQGFDLGHGRSLTIAAEHAEAEITALDDGSAHGVSKAPNLVLAARQEGSWGHLQAAALLRRLDYLGDLDSDSATGAGITVSGSLLTTDRDMLVFGGIYGKGISAYLGDILGIGLDAAVDNDGNLQTLRSSGGWAAYTHYWNARWRSNLVYGQLRLQDSALLADTAFRESQYAAANLIWSPVPSWTMGLELLYGQLERQDGIDGDLTRLQGTLKYDFIK
ncbi:porin-like protein [Luteimonas cucumeris]|uniref:Porin-like protein n=1 Tax=Luteimonas cucumeris TaxID=985012 RepID=A0A562LFA5_9GAMM|nr:DcaP family trimeric outer membrane transporter [Luteimonas cucumeris]TWI06285.1 porin-like protein [Luteimonas cucumeris]